MVEAAERRWRWIYLFTMAVGVETLTAPVLVMFYTDYVGYAFSTYSYLMAMILAFAWVLQIPCGALADRFGRKRCLIGGNLLYASALLSLLLWKSHVPEVCVALLFASGVSLSGGSLQSMLYEHHARRNAQADFHKLMAKGTSVSLGVGALAAVAGGYLAKVSPALPMAVDLSLLLLLTVVQFFAIREERLGKPPGNSHRLRYADILKSGLLVLKSDRTLVVLIVAAAIQFALLRTGFNFYQPMLLTSDVRVEHLGWYFAGMFLTSSFSAHCFGKAWKPVADSIWPIGLMACMQWVAIVAVLADHGRHGWGLVALAIISHQVVRGVWPSYFSFRINGRLAKDASNRTTVLACSGFVRSVVAATFMALSGLFASHFAPGDMFGLLTLFAAVATLASMALLARKEADHANSLSPEKN